MTLTLYDSLVQFKKYHLALYVLWGKYKIDRFMEEILKNDHEFFVSRPQILIRPEA